MNSGELFSENDRCARAGGSSRREFLGRTIRGGALLAATTVLGNDLRSPENQAESQTNYLPRNPSAEARATTADLLAEKLVEWGVSVVFGLPGDKIAHILDAIRRRQDKIRFVLVRHEEGAAFMASGHAKFTGKLGVCISTAGPGAVHLLNGLYDAKFDGVPVLAITGAPPQALLGTRFTQGVDTISLYNEVTSGVYNELITGPYHLPGKSRSFSLPMPWSHSIAGPTRSLLRAISPWCQRRNLPLRQQSTTTQMYLHRMTTFLL